MSPQEARVAAPPVRPSPRIERFGEPVPEDTIFESDPVAEEFPNERRSVVMESRPGSPFERMRADEPGPAFAVRGRSGRVRAGYRAPIEKAGRGARLAPGDVALSCP